MGKKGTTTPGSSVVDLSMLVKQTLSERWQKKLSNQEESPFLLSFRIFSFVLKNLC